ncbi:MAG: beta-lactamase family protein [Candidatus Levybacteria bacterium]|nr:beta-lactamase family protein [Candidatus Levybacteria bacterium]
MEETIAQIVRGAIEDSVFPGCVVGIIKNGRKIILSFGNYTYEYGAKAMHTESIFDIASITKSIPTSSLALLLIDRGKMRLDDKLIKYLPEFRNPDREQVLIWHLLTHTLDFDLTLSSLKNLSPGAILERIYTAKLKSKPGTKYAYVNATSILLGLVSERVTGEKLDAFSEREFFQPLGMSRTTFHPEKFEKTEIVPTEIDGWRGRLIQGEVHDESAYSLRKKYIVGSAGVFSTASDLLTFLEMLLYMGSYKEKKYFSEGIVKEMYTNQLGRLGIFGGLGWELCQPRFMGKYATKNTFGKTGFTGCLVLCDPEKQIGIVILSNFTYPERKSDKNIRDRVFREVADIIFLIDNLL